MGEKQVWEIIKNFNCADLKIVVDPAVAVWNHQQSKIDEHTEVIKLQDTDLRKYEKQIESLKEQLNNMEACYIQVKKECEDQQKRIDDGLEKIHQFGKEGCLFPEWLIWAEKALRGGS